MRRERWEPGLTVFEIDHHLPVAARPELALDYNNLRYCCDVCNSVKSRRLLADPCHALLAGNLTLESNGQIIGQSPTAGRPPHY